MRSQQIVAVLDTARSPLSARELVPEVYRDLDPRFYPIAELQLQSHLLWLQEMAVVEPGHGNQFLLIHAMKLQTTLEAAPWKN
jgi:hypothetical protein